MAFILKKFRGYTINDDTLPLTSSSQIPKQIDASPVTPVTKTPTEAPSFAQVTRQQKQTDTTPVTPVTKPSIEEQASPFVPVTRFQKQTDTTPVNTVAKATVTGIETSPVTPRQIKMATDDENPLAGVYSSTVCAYCFYLKLNTYGMYGVFVQAIVYCP